VKCSTCDVPKLTFAPQARAFKISTTKHHNSNPKKTRLADITSCRDNIQLVSAVANANGAATADAFDLAEMGDPWTGMPAASADYQRSSAHHTVSPFTGVDDQIADAIIVLNRLPNAIERQARDGYRWSSWSAQKVRRSQAWVRTHEPELMERADVSFQILSITETCANKNTRHLPCSWGWELTQKTTPSSANCCSRLVSLLSVFFVGPLY
jgi:hypothetical protein